MTGRTHAEGLLARHAPALAVLAGASTRAATLTGFVDQIERVAARLTGTDQDAVATHLRAARARLDDARYNLLTTPDEQAALYAEADKQMTLALAGDTR